MLKRIPSQHLRVGMYIQELCGSWLEHPFWRTSFLLKDPRDIRRIIESGTHEVWIDTSKGLDVESDEDVETEESAEKRVDESLAQIALRTAQTAQTSVTEEAARAAMICSRAKNAVSSMFREARMGKALDAADAMPLVEEISYSLTRNPGALINLARLKDKDDYTYMHSVAVCGLMIALARQLGLDEQQVKQAGVAGLLHDIGKMTIPPEVLGKPGKLTDAEFELVKSHPKEGYLMLLEGKGVDDVALDVCLHHHEKVDGSGYPDRLSSDQISLFSKMGAVCDVYDAITSNRPYKAGWEPAESLRKMAEWSKGHFDNTIFQAFVRSIGIYPVGSLVRLQSERLAVVMDQSGKSLLTPQVKVFFSIKTKSRIHPEILDLSKAGVRDKIVSHENPAQWGITDVVNLWSGLPGRPW